MKKIITIWIAAVMMLSGIFTIFSMDNRGFPVGPYNRWGYAYDVGAMPLDTELTTAWIDGVQYGTTVTWTGADVGLFSIDTIGDDTTPDDIKTGGYNGDTIYYVHGDLTPANGGTFFLETDTWLVSGFINGDLNEHPSSPALLKINNVSAQSTYPVTDYIVIYNPTSSPVDASTFSLSVAEAAPVPISVGDIVPGLSIWNDITIPAFGNLALDMATWGSLNSTGNSIKLLETPTGYVVDRVEYGNIPTEPENTIMSNASAPGAGNEIRRTNYGSDTNDCSSDFIISGQYLPLGQAPGSPSVLLVDADSFNDGLVDYYIWPLQNNSATVTVWDVYGNNGPVQGKPGLSNMTGYDVVIWIPGRYMGGGADFDAADESEVANYLNGGGTFMLANGVWSDFTDGGSMWYSPGDFAYDYLGVDSIIDPWSLSEWYVTGFPGTIFDNYGPAFFDWMRGNWFGFCGELDWLQEGLGSVGLENDGFDFQDRFLRIRV
jgi:hypothetical protein